MASYRYIRELWNRKQSDVLRFLNRVRTWEMRQLPSVFRRPSPLRPDKARRLGYEAKQGFVVYSVRVRKGGSKRQLHKGIVHGKPRNQGVNEQKYFRSDRVIAEMRAGRRCGALRVLNSYWTAEDGTYKWYDVIMVDPMHRVIRNDPRINWICAPVMKHREMRGLTSAGQKSRGLHHKGNKVAKLRPSHRATWKRHITVSLRRYR